MGRILLCRPAIEAGESLGFLPGDVEQKLAPYLPAALRRAHRSPGRQAVKTLLADGTIEIAPVAYMRGARSTIPSSSSTRRRNCTYGQLKMLLTRLGWHSTMVLTGDPDQSDLLPGMSGFAEIARRLDALDGVAVVELGEADVVRHPLVASILSVI